MTIPEQLAAALADLDTATKALAAEQANSNRLADELAAEKATNVSLTVALSDLTAKITDSEAKRLALSAEVASLQAAAKTASEQATDMASRIGVAPVAPAGSGAPAASDMTLDEVRAAMAKATDSREKGRLAILSRKIRGLT